MMMKALPTAIATALVLSSLPAAAAPPLTCERLLVSSKRPPLLEGKPRFATTDTVDLDFNVVFPTAFAGKHTLKVEFFTPNGHLYQKLTVPVDDASSKVNQRAFRGFPRPLAVKRLQPFQLAGAERKVAKVRFPLAGTSIVRSGMYGTWKVDVYLDDGKEPCASTELEIVDRPDRP